MVIYYNIRKLFMQLYYDLLILLVVLIKIKIPLINNIV